VSLLDNALNQYHHEFDKVQTKTLIVDFIFDRLKGYCLDKGYAPDEFEAVMAVKPRQPLDFMKRLQAVKAFRQLPEAGSLAAANKRIRNILKKSETALVHPSQIRDFAEAEERELLTVANQSVADIQPLLAGKDYQAALSRLAKTEPAVNAFFDKVMVMADDLGLRAKRLGLLNMLSEQFLQIADISKLQS
jgi:glycyl-tRNA synthetase beta chain